MADTPEEMLSAAAKLLRAWMDGTGTREVLGALTTMYLSRYDALPPGEPGTSTGVGREPTCRRVCVMAIQGGDTEPREDDHCDLYEASEIGTPCAGLCHVDPRQPFDGICPRCGTHGNEGERCKVCKSGHPGVGSGRGEAGK